VIITHNHILSPL